MKKLYFYVFFLLSGVLFFGACDSRVSDPKDGLLSDGSSTQNPKNSDSNSTVPGSGGSGTGGNCYEDPSIGRTCTSEGGDKFGDPNVNGVISVDLLNLNNNEFLKGGNSYYVKYRTHISYAKFKSVYSKLEFKRESDADWKLIADKIVSNDNEIVSYNWNICPHVEGKNCLLDASGNPILLNGLDFKIRVTSKRLDNQSGTVQSSGYFTIDSISPSLATTQPSPKKGFGIKQSNLNGFIELEIYAASDNLNRVSHLCLKLETTTPDQNDSCWVSTMPFNPVYSVSSQQDMTIVSIPVFLGFTAKASLNYYLWIKDQSGNVSTMTSNTVDDVTTYGLAGKDKVVLSQSSVSHSGFSLWNPDTHTLTPTFNADLTLNSNASASGTIAKYASGDSALNMGDPGSLVVTSAGVAYIKHNGTPKGILRFDLNNGTYSVLIPQGNHLTGGTATARVYDPLRIALDSNEDLWVMDKTQTGDVLISKVTNLSTASPHFDDLIGGGSQITSDDKSATDLKITYSDNLRWFGSFSSLPDGSLMFSSEDPVKQLKPASGNVFSLRFYNPNRSESLRISTLTMKTVNSKGEELTTENGDSLKDLEVYGVSTAVFDFQTSEIKKIYLRACAPTGVGASKTCNDLVSLVFDGKGQFLEQIQSFTPWHWGNVIFSSHRSGQIFMMNALQGTLSKISSNEAGSSWLSLLSDFGAGASYCANDTPSGNCQVRIKDFFVTEWGRVFFVDQNRLRFIDDDGKVKSILSFKAGE